VAGQTRRDLLDVLNLFTDRATLMTQNASDPSGPGSPALFPLFWRAGGEQCNLRFGFGDGSSSSSGGGSSNSLLQQLQPRPAAAAAPVGSGSRAGVLNSAGGAAAAAAAAASGPGGLVRAAGAQQGPDAWKYETVGCSVGLRSGRGQQWWDVQCGAQDADGMPVNGTSDPDHAECGAYFKGPQAVVVLEKVQTGIIGATLSSFGITGLYITFVYGLGRFLRLSFSNLRLKIPYEDLPSTRRLVALCQDLYIARAQGELVLEEELYNVLINVYRSPAVLFELTRKHKTS